MTELLRTFYSVLMDTAHPATECFDAVTRRWHARHSTSDGLPSSQEFQLDGLSDFPSRVSVIAPVNEGEDFRYVIYAGAIVDACGVDMTGYLFSDFRDENLRTATLRNARQVLKERKPGIWRYRHDWMERTYDYCCLYLPLQHGENNSIRIHSIIVNTDPERRQLYTGRFENTRKAVKPDQLECTHRKV